MPFKDFLKIIRRGSRRASGYLAVALLKVIGHLPPEPLVSLLSLALPLYPWLRPKHSQRIRNCFKASPFHPELNLRLYYRMRLRIFLLGLKQHGASIRENSISIQGMEYFQSALASNRPVILLGIHSGLFELLHRVPRSGGRRFFTLTAPAFAPALTNFMAKGRLNDGKEILWNRSKNPSIKIGAGFYTGLKIVLRTKGILAVMVDQNPDQVSKADTLLLWNKIQIAYPARLLSTLARHGACLMPISTVLHDDGTSQINFHPELGSNIESALKAYLEKTISTAPEQWNWSYPKIMALED